MQSQQTLQVLFTDAMGLEIGDKIMYRGMEAGRIKEVNLHPDGILCRGKISSAIKIPERSRFYIEDSLMGSKSLQIVPSDALTYLNLAKVQRGESSVGMMSMLANAASTLNRVDAILAKLDQDGGIIDQGESLIQDTRSTVITAKTGIIDLKVQLSALIDEADALTSKIHKMASENQDNLKQSMALAPATLEKINTSLDSLAALSNRLHASASALQEGKGTAGKLLTEDELYHSLMKSINNLDALILDVKANPKKYVKFSLF